MEAYRRDIFPPDYETGGNVVPFKTQEMTRWIEVESSWGNRKFTLPLRLFIKNPPLIFG